MSDYSLLDNPVWQALTGPHQKYAVSIGDLLGYRTEYGPFAAAATSRDISAAMDEYYSYAGEFFVVGQRPAYRGQLQLKRELVCLQMICDEHGVAGTEEDIISLLPYRQEVIELVNLVQPGFFRSHTMDMGAYYGIFKGTQLVAITGERMQLHGFTEVSAVVTHPEHTGNGYAKRLVNFVTGKIIAEGNVAFLHVTATNQRAIRLYELAGYRTRKEISFWHYDGWS